MTRHPSQYSLPDHFDEPAAATNHPRLPDFGDREQDYFELLMGWPLFRSIRKAFDDRDVHPGLLIHGFRGFLVEAGRHKKIICACCGGFGHTSKKCPTLPRLR